MWLLGDRNELILLTSTGKGSAIKYKLVCVGRKRHYRKDGSCKHTAALLETIGPWRRSRTEVALNGGKGARSD